MDPNANLHEQLYLAAQLQTMAEDPRDARTIPEAELKAFQADFCQKAIRLAALVRSLDLWISRGGGLPSSWQRFDEG